MRRIFTWLNKRFGTFDLLPEYFTAAGQQIQNVLWGALLPFLAWGIWFIVGTPPTWVNATAVGVALFLSGYYVWRADHIRLQQRIKIGRVTRQRWTVPIEHGIPGATRGADAFYFEVIGTSEAMSMHNVHVSLAEIIPQVENFEWLPVPLRQKHDHNWHGAKEFDLNPSERKNIDFISALVGDDFFDVMHLVPGVNQRVPVESGRHYRLKVEVTAQDIPMSFEWFDVWIDEEGVLQCRMESDSSDFHPVHSLEQLSTSVEKSTSCASPWHVSPKAPGKVCPKCGLSFPREGVIIDSGEMN